MNNMLYCLLVLLPFQNYMLDYQMCSGFVHLLIIDLSMVELHVVIAQ